MVAFEAAPVGTVCTLIHINSANVHLATDPLLLTPGLLFNMNGQAGEGSEGLRHSKHTVAWVQTWCSEVMGCCDVFPHRCMFPSQVQPEVAPFQG